MLFNSIYTGSRRVLSGAQLTLKGGKGTTIRFSSQGNLQNTTVWVPPTRPFCRWWVAVHLCLSMTLQETPCKRLAAVTPPHEEVDLNLTVLNGRSVLVIGWAVPPNGPAASFGRSFGDVPDDQKADVAIQLAAEHIENIYMRPSWWRDLTEHRKNRLIERMHSGVRVRGRNCLRPDGHPYTTDVHVKEKVYL